MNRLLSKLEEIWCRNMHAEVMWPIRGQYRCRQCLRTYPVAFETTAAPAPRAPDLLKTATAAIG